MKKIFLFSIVLVLLIPAATSAMVLKAGQTYALPKNETLNENLYAAGGTITFLGKSAKDVWLAGGTILVSGDVIQDLTISGGNIDISNKVGDDLRAAGGNVTINSEIGGELILLGGQLIVSNSAKIAGDATIVGGNILAAGSFGRNLAINGGTIEIAGNVSGNVKVRSSQKLVISSSAVINGNLDYSSPKQAEIQSGAKIQGKTTFTEISKKAYPTESKHGLLAILGIFWLISFFTVLLTALVAWALLRRPIETAIKYGAENFWPATLRGLAIAIILPIIAIIALVTIVGAMLGGLAILVYVLFAVLASVLASMMLGTFIWRLILKKKDFVADWRSIIVGVVAMRVIQLIPVIGWIFSAIFFLASFGAVFYLAWKHFKNSQT